MKKYCLLLILPVLLTFSIVSCQSKQTYKTSQTTPFPTPFVLDEILASSQFSDTSNTLCSEEDYYKSLPADYQAKGWELQVAHPPVATGAGIGGISVSNGTLLALDTYEVPEQQTIGISIQYLYLGTGQENDTKPYPMRFILLLDEQQVTIKINGVFQSYYDVFFYPRQGGSIVLEVPPLEPGIHDLNLIGFSQADNEPNYQPVNTLTYRFTLVSGGVNSLLPRPYTSLRAAKRFWIKREIDTGVGIQLSLEKTQPLDWNYPNPLLEISPGEALDFFAYAGYISTSNSDYPDEPLAAKQPFALVMLMDYQQSGFSSETPVVYGVVAPTTVYARIPVHLLPSQLPGFHQITVIRITYPGFPVCLLDDHSVTPKVRVYPDTLDFSRAWFDIVP